MITKINRYAIEIFEDDKPIAYASFRPDIKETHILILHSIEFYSRKDAVKLTEILKEVIQFAKNLEKYTVLRTWYDSLSFHEAGFEIKKGSFNILEIKL